MRRKGKAGCGCLIFMLVAIMVIIGVTVHPFTLRIIGKQFRYEDKVFPSDVIFTPRFPEDKNGESYIEAFREYWAGNGKAILIEEDKILGISIVELVRRMAKERGVKDALVKGIEGKAGKTKADSMKEELERMGFKKVIILVPEYASRRYHLLYSGSDGDGKTLYIIKPVSVSYYKKDKWWKDAESRYMLLNEVYSVGAYYFDRFKNGEKKDSKK